MVVVVEAEVGLVEVTTTVDEEAALQAETSTAPTVTIKEAVRVVHQVGSTMEKVVVITANSPIRAGTVVHLESLVAEEKETTPPLMTGILVVATTGKVTAARMIATVTTRTHSRATGNRVTAHSRTTRMTISRTTVRTTTIRMTDPMGTTTKIAARIRVDIATTTTNIILVRQQRREDTMTGGHRVMLLAVTLTMGRAVSATTVILPTEVTAGIRRAITVLTVTVTVVAAIANAPTTSPFNRTVVTIKVDRLSNTSGKPATRHSTLEVKRPYGSRIEWTPIRMLIRKN
jgi:hypothetical protein